jgi:hypothetical protein
LKKIPNFQQRSRIEAASAKPNKLHGALMELRYQSQAIEEQKGFNYSPGFFKNFTDYSERKTSASCNSLKCHQKSQIVS